MKLLTVKELSEIIKVKESTLYAWAKRGSIPSHKLNGLLRFDIEEVENWVRNSKEQCLPGKIPNPKTFRKKDINAVINRAIESVRNGL